MKNVIIPSVLILPFLFSSGDLKPETHEEGMTRYNLSPAFPALEFDMPVELTSPLDNSNRVFVVEQKGKIMSFPNQADVKSASVFLDIVKKVDSGGEKGLLGLAFHPDYKNNGYFYVNYTRSSPLETIISRFKVSPSNTSARIQRRRKFYFGIRNPIQITTVARLHLEKTVISTFLLAMVAAEEIRTTMDRT